MSVSGRKTLPDVRETLSDDWEYSGGSLRCPGVVVRLSRMSGSGRKTLLNVREWWEALPDVWKWSGGLLDCSGVVERPSRMTGIGRKACRMSGIC